MLSSFHEASGGPSVSIFTKILVTVTEGQVGLEALGLESQGKEGMSIWLFPWRSQRSQFGPEKTG